jgi:hypothetical protein
MSKFSGGFISKNPINNGGISIEHSTEKEAVKSFVFNTFKKANEKSGFSKGIEENKKWVKDNPWKAAGVGILTAAKWSPWGFKKYFQGGKVAINLIKKLF